MEDVQSGQAFLTIYNSLRRGDNAKLKRVAGFQVTLTIESNNTLIILRLKERVIARMASIQGTPRLPRFKCHYEIRCTFSNLKYLDNMKSLVYMKSGTGSKGP